MDTRSNHNVQSVVRAFRILELLGQEERSLSLGELSKGLRINKTTARRFLITLKNIGYVYQDLHTKLYNITPKLSRLGHSAEQSLSLVSIIKPYMDILARETGETINFAVLNGTEVHYKDKRDSSHSLRVCIDVGEKAPAHATALGKAILAFLPTEEIYNRFNRGMSLERFTRNTIQSWAELDVEFVRIREEGIACDNEELFDGLRCIAAPIFQKKQVVAALSISIPTTRCDEHRLAVFKKLLIKQTKNLNEQIP